MTVERGDGPLGLEAKHIWTPRDGSGSLTMHDLTVGLPRVKFDRMPGFRSLPEADDNRTPRTARPGENTQPSLVRGRSYTTEGRLQASSLQELRQLNMACLRAFSERNLQGLWSAIPLSPYADDVSNYWQSSARVLTYDPQEEFTTPPTHPLGPWQLPFTMGFRQGDARWTWTDEQSESDAEELTVTNWGNAPAEPVIRIDNPGDTVSMQNGANFGLLRFSGIAGPFDYLEVDFAARTATLGGVSDALPYLDTYNSTWWDRNTAGLVAGDNDILQTGGDLLTVTWKHTSW